MRSALKKIPGQWKFMFVVLFVYLFVYFVDSQFAKVVFVNFLDIAKKVAPIVVIVFLVMFGLNLFVKPAIIQKHLGKDSGLKGWFYAIVGSILISGPPYVLLPMLSNLKKQGMKTSLLAVFLSNRSVQPVFLPVMAFYFGWEYALVVSLLIVVFSILNGLAIGELENRNYL